MKVELDRLSPIMLMFLVSQYNEQTDTSDVELMPGKYMTEKMQYPRKVSGKFKYYPEFEYMADYVMYTFKMQLLRIR